MKLFQVHEKEIQSTKTRTERVSVTGKFVLEGTSSLSLLSAAAATEHEKELRDEEKRRKKEEEAKKKEEKRQEKEKRKREREAIRCKTIGCNRQWNNRSELDECWIWCDYCDEFGFCWKCDDSEDAQKSMAQHERACKKSSQQAKRMKK